MRAWIVIAAMGLSGLIASGATRAALDRPDVATMAPAEITALQRRLTDAGCYAGPVDGQPSDTTTAAVAACPDQRPQLRIEMGMHVAAINRIGVDAGCTIAATASDDKTLRLWSMPDGRLLRTLRWPIGGNNRGKVYATAVSPDGRFVAAGGWDARYEVSSTFAVTIFDTASGAVVTRVGTFENVIDNLAFSPDGARLATTLGGGEGVRIIDTATRRQVAADKGYGSDSYGATFGPDGRLYTVAMNGKLRRYAPGPGFALEQSVMTRGGKRPYSVAIDGGGTLLAVGYDNTTAVDLYDSKTLAPAGKAETTRIDNGTLSAVAWRADGQALIAGGKYIDATSFRPVLIFNRAGRRLRGQPLAKAENTIMNLQSCGAGFAVAASDPAFGLLDPSGRAKVWRTGVAPDMRAKVGDAFTIAADAKSIRFVLDARAGRPVVFNALLASLSDNAGAPAGFYPATIQGLPLTDWMNQTAPRFGPTPIKLENNETSRSLAIRPDRSGFVLGTDYYLRAYGAQGGERWSKPVPDAAWRVNLSADGRVIVAAYGDGTIRWHRWSDGAELLAFFVNKETKAWVAWTPSGYYSASPGGEDMIGWHVNRGWAQAADFFPASRFRDQFARPDIVEKVLDTLDEAAAVTQANAARGIKASASGVTDRLPPVVAITAPAEGASVGTEVKLDYLVRSPSGLPVTAVEVLVDGRPVSAARGLERVADEAAFKQCLVETRGLGRVDGALQGCRGSVTVALPPGAREVGLFARAGDRVGEVTKIRLTRAAAAMTEAVKPKLYALVVGVSAYANPDYALNFAAKDAGDFAAALKNQMGGLYADVDITLLTDAKATGQAIRDGFDRLAQKVTNRDVGLIYLAGHGVLDARDRFYFLAADSDAEKLQSTAIPRGAIADALDGLAGKALLFLDACHAGAVAAKAGRRDGIDINGVVNDLTSSERGVVAFTASTGRQLSQENAAWNNGAFTKAVVEGLGLPGQRGKADLLGNGQITTSALDAYVTQRVAALTNGAQSPVMIRPSTVPDFALAATH